MRDKVRKFSNRIAIKKIRKDFSIGKFNDAGWRIAGDVRIEKYWSGELAPAGRHASAKLLWSDTALYVSFEASQTEPLIVSQSPNLKSKTIGLWDKDVCEIFIAPDRSEPRKYFEFEIAPTGEWLDLAIDYTSGKREIDQDYESGMQSSTKIEELQVVMAIKIEWKALGNTPQVGDIWLGNLFRCVGPDADRGYLAWQPTQSETPNFHVPKKFGEFEFHQ